jgi:hypothetical protein
VNKWDADLLHFWYKYQSLAEGSTQKEELDIDFWGSKNTNHA